MILDEDFIAQVGLEYGFFLQTLFNSSVDGTLTTTKDELVELFPFSTNKSLKFLADAKKGNAIAIEKDNDNIIVIFNLESFVQNSEKTVFKNLLVSTTETTKTKETKTKRLLNTTKTEFRQKRTNEILSAFQRYHKAKFGVSYAVSFTKDRAAINRLPEDYTIPMLDGTLVKFFVGDNWHFKTRGATVQSWVAALPTLLPAGTRPPQPRKRLIVPGVD